MLFMIIAAGNPTCCTMTCLITIGAINDALFKTAQLLLSFRYFECFSYLGFYLYYDMFAEN